MFRALGIYNFGMGQKVKEKNPDLNNLINCMCHSIRSMTLAKGSKKAKTPSRSIKMVPYSMMLVGLPYFGAPVIIL